MKRSLIELLLLLAGTSVLAHAKEKHISIEVVETTEERLLSKNPPAATYSAKVILPDGAHAFLVCFLYMDGCGAIVPWTPPEKTTPADCQTFDNNGDISVICKRKNLGAYQAKRKGDDLLIYSRKGTVKYQIGEGQWQ
jgi:hypothetical protein